ncbi:hypothetical protein [Devosia sediminis]|uniref:Uncharacterized protein n=1 Tax=Devosia sediminis TaxID=2798801 RepID=A0A934ISD6_9HYPH|nr:hypothetical protein [Devosia sediminis]MBJ3783427.1 hypothetical protein [Devosia sediminis]
MAYTFMESDTHCLLIAEVTMIWRKPDSGDKFAPYKNPLTYLHLIEFCSHWDYYTVRNRATVSMTHQSVPGRTITDARGFGTASVIYRGQTYAQEQVLLYHGAGYPPRFVVSQGGRVLPQGMNVQNLGDRARFVSFNATATDIICYNVGTSSDADLPALTVSYDVLVFKDASEVPVGPQLPMFWATDTRAIMGRGRFDTNTTTMRRGTGADSPFFLALAASFDFDVGRMRVVLPNGSIITEPGYAGGFTGAPFQRIFA